MAIERTYSRELEIGKNALVKGWVWIIRDIGGLKFFILRDREGVVQVTAKKGNVSEKILDTVSKLGREDCVVVHGTVKKAPQAPGGMEIVPESVEIISKAATPLPLETTDKIVTGMDKRFEYRFLDMRNPKVQAIFRVRDKAIAKMREYFESQKFVEIHTPIIQAAGAEGGATLFPLIYYKREAFLRQSPQLYKQIMMASTLDRVYEIGPVFRAEAFHTRRHVSEFLSVDGEMAWIESEEDVLKMIEGMVAHTVKELKKECAVELETLGAKPIVPELPFPRVTYTEVLKLLAKEGQKIEWGEDLSDPHEKLLGEIMAKKGKEWYFITEYPAKIKPFYIMMDGKISHGFDLDFKGLEIVSGGQREHRYDKLVAMMKSKGLDPEKFKFYIDAFQYGMPPHGGFGLGLDRFVQQVVGMENVKEVILFPRTPEKLIP